MSVYSVANLSNTKILQSLQKAPDSVASNLVTKEDLLAVAINIDKGLITDYSDKEKVALRQKIDNFDSAKNANGGPDDIYASDADYAKLISSLPSGPTGKDSLFPLNSMA